MKIQQSNPRRGFNFKINRLFQISFRQNLILVLACLVIPAMLPAISGGCRKGEEIKRPAAYVDPFIGTAAHGHTFPGAMVPFGMVQLSPDTRKDSWDGCSGYHYSDNRIFGFSHTHLSGTGVGDYGDIRLLPWSGDIKPVKEKYESGELPYSHFSHKREQAGAGYYQVALDDAAVIAELTAGERCGFHRYTFSDDAQFVVLDIAEGVTSDEILGLELSIVNEYSLSGMKRSSGWADDQYVFFHAVFSKPFAGIEVLEEGRRLEGSSFKSMNDLTCILSFEGGGDEVLMVKVGISAVDTAGARKNLESCTPGWDFDGMRQNAYEAWDAELSRITVEGGTHAQRVVFYTALYHAFMAPYLYSDADGRYRGHDMQIHQAGNTPVYTVFSLWDTFRALHPLFTIVQQERTGEFINTMLDIHDKGGLLPVWELAANETGCMIGYHSVPVIADARVKGIRGFNMEKAYEAMKKSSMQDTEGLQYYRRYGYIPAGMDGSSVSKTLEYAYDDWCIALMAKEMGMDEDYDEYIQRAQYYKNIFDPETGFMRGKMNGMWVTPFDPLEVNFMLTEANTWQYNFFVPQDISGLMALYGGEEGFVGKLDEMFNAGTAMTGRQQSDITGLIGQYAHGNEPSHHMAYLYNFAGEAWKTQELVRKIMDELYTERPDGLCGNEDCGQMSAWYVFSAMGFYPVTPGTDYYVTGSPLFDKVGIRLENGNTVIIEARNVSARNKYIQSTSLNGKPLHESFIRHDDIMKGGHFVFEMGPEPNKKWGREAEHRPATGIVDQLITAAPYLIADSRTFESELEIGMDCPDTDAVIRYTLDGSEPGMSSAIYQAPFIIYENTRVRFFSKAPGKHPSKVIEGFFSLMPEGRKVIYHTSYDPQYSAGGDIALIDLIRGGDNFRTGSWQGFHGVDVELLIDLGRAQYVESVRAGFLQDQGSWIFMPEWVAFSLSADGENFEPAGRENCPIDPRDKGGVIHDFAVMPRKDQVRYIKVVARNRAVCPDWHPGAGQAAWLFIDEVLVE
jgi:predicted alpha-1,2-mannosidase